MMSKIPKPPITSSVSIKLELPDNYNVSGDTETKVREKVIGKPRDEEDKQFLEMLHKHLEMLEQQKQVTINMINIVKKRLGLCCGKGV